MSHLHCRERCNTNADHIRPSVNKYELTDFPCFSSIGWIWRHGGVPRRASLNNGERARGTIVTCYSILTNVWVWPSMGTDIAFTRHRCSSPIAKSSLNAIVVHGVISLSRTISDDDDDGASFNSQVVGPAATQHPLWAGPAYGTTRPIYAIINWKFCKLFLFLRFFPGCFPEKRYQCIGSNHQSSGYPIIK